MTYKWLKILIPTVAIVSLGMAPGIAVSLLRADDDDRTLIKTVEHHRIQAIEAVIGSVIAIYDEDRQGGGSGVIIDPSGIALTNHHVIMGAGIKGWGGLADGELYRWRLIGTDPGGDVSIIQMEGRDDFPFTPLGDSDQVRVGDWALAMGNPFILTEDQSPTVTLGIVSGVKRYQPGAGLNQLVYGNCIQVDSSINPGNSGGPLFNLQAEVIGINGRGSFKERGRVNVGLGYAISSNQIKNFIPELLATKLVEHATLDASFSDRDGKVLCSQLNLDAPVAAAGLAIADELIEFEGIKIKNANQFTNLICTLPEDWPTELKIRKPDGTMKTIVVRTFGLPYLRPKPPAGNPGGDRKRNPEQEKQLQRQREMVKLLAAPPGEIRHQDVNRKYARQIVQDWQAHDGPSPDSLNQGMVKLVDQIFKAGEAVGKSTTWLAADGRVRVEVKLDDEVEQLVFDGNHFFASKEGETKELTNVEAKLNLMLVQALSLSAAFQSKPFQVFGKTMIDGADKSLGRNAYRMRILDQDQDQFFCWLQMYGSDGRPAARLTKASAHRDCEETGGVTFADWERVGPVMIAKQRNLVRGLEEEVRLTLANQSAEWVEKIDKSLFGDAESETAESTEVDADKDAADDDELKGGDSANELNGGGSPRESN